MQADRSEREEEKGMDYSELRRRVRKTEGETDVKQATYFYDLTDRERELLETLAELPPDVQDKFLLMAQGAAMAVEAAREAAAAAAPAGEAEDGGAA